MDSGINELKILDELKHDMLNIMTNCSYQKIQKYKAFIEQNDQVSFYIDQFFVLFFCYEANCSNDQTNYQIGRIVS